MTAERTTNPAPMPLSELFDGLARVAEEQIDRFLTTPNLTHRRIRIAQLRATADCYRNCGTIARARNV